MRLLSSKDIVAELLCVLHWSEEARRTYVKAMRSYQRAGSPPIPMDSVNYQIAYRKEQQRRRRKQ